MQTVKPRYEALLQLLGGAALLQPLHGPFSAMSGQRAISSVSGAPPCTTTVFAPEAPLKSRA